MLQAIKSELILRAPQWQSLNIETIYFGGGTPSLLTGEEVAELLLTVSANYNCDTVSEITLECNPDDCSLLNLKAWKTAGISRLSIGIQSFESSQLEWMNRTHTAEEGIAAISRAKSVGYQHLTADLMYGLPGLTLSSWKTALDKLCALELDHISAYCLTVEPKTALDKWVNSGKLEVSSNDHQSKQFEVLVEMLEKHGFEQYEISNFARKEAYSKHNSAYWKGIPYVGIGPSAHGFTGEFRYSNIANNTVYMDQIEASILPETIEILFSKDRFNELLLIGLRTKWGVEKQELFQGFKPTLNWFQRIMKYTSSHQLIETETHYILSVNGRLQADGIASDLFLEEKDVK